MFYVNSTSSANVTYKVFKMFAKNIKKRHFLTFLSMFAKHQNNVGCSFFGMFTENIKTTSFPDIILALLANDK